MREMTITTNRGITISIEGGCYVKEVMGIPTEYIPLMGDDGKYRSIKLTMTER